MSCQNKLGFLCGGLPLRLQLCWWFSVAHICSSEIGQSQPFAFIGTERLSEDKNDVPARAVISLYSFCQSQEAIMSGGVENRLAAPSGFLL